MQLRAWRELFSAHCFNITNNIPHRFVTTSLIWLKISISFYCFELSSKCKLLLCSTFLIGAWRGARDIPICSGLSWVQASALLPCQQCTGQLLYHTAHGPAELAMLQLRGSLEIFSYMPLIAVRYPLRNVNFPSPHAHQRLCVLGGCYQMLKIQLCPPSRIFLLKFLSSKHIISSAFRGFCCCCCFYSISLYND